MWEQGSRSAFIHRQFRRCNCRNMATELELLAFVNKLMFLIPCQPDGQMWHTDEPSSVPESIPLGIQCNTTLSLKVERKYERASCTALVDKTFVCIFSQGMCTGKFNGSLSWSPHDHMCSLDTNGNAWHKQCFTVQSSANLMLCLPYHAYSHCCLSLNTTVLSSESLAPHFANLQLPPQAETHST